MTPDEFKELCVSDPGEANAMVAEALHPEWGVRMINGACTHAVPRYATGAGNPDRDDVLFGKMWRALPHTGEDWDREMGHTREHGVERYYVTSDPDCSVKPYTEVYAGTLLVAMATALLLELKILKEDE